jgi:two-component system NtrC family sensor kinase
MKGNDMTTEGMSIATDSAHIISTLFVLLPVPVAVVDNKGYILLSNSAFNETFQGIRNVKDIPRHEFHVPGRGTFEIETLPLTDQGLSILFASDVTKEVQLRKQMMHLEKMAAIGRMVSGVAHELNNPLAGVVGYAQLVSRNSLDPASQRMIDVILVQAERAGRIVQDFLSLAARTDPKRVHFDLNETVRRIVQLREYNDRLEGIAVTMDLADDLPPATGDSSQIEQVLLNLIVNAADAISHARRRAGLIHIRTSAEGPRISIAVSDNGSGIHARDMSRIFDPFFTTKDEHEGTGLGLSICSEIVKNHGGELYAWSTYGAGSTFTVELPVLDSVDVEEIVPERPTRGQELSGKSILVIDDEIHITELIFDVLARYGAKVDVANAGAEALTQLQAKHYDAVICDQRMPSLSGQQLYRLVQSAHPELENRFLFVTGDVVNSDTKNFFQQAGVLFLRKPFRIYDLVDSVETLLNRNRPQDS